MFFVLAVESFLLVRLGLVVRGSGTFKIPILLEIAVRRVPVVFCELAIVNCLREVLDLRFRKWTGKYSRKRVILYIKV